MDLASLEYIKNIAIENAAALITGGIVVLLIFVFWLVFRGLRLWYWKVNQRTAALKHIEDDVAFIRQELAREKAIEEAKIRLYAEKAEPSFSKKADIDNTYKVVEKTEQVIGYKREKEKIDDEINKKENFQKEIKCDQSENESIPIALNFEEPRKIGKYTDRECGHAKDGTIYTREEIEACIKD